MARGSWWCEDGRAGAGGESDAGRGGSRELEESGGWRGEPGGIEPALGRAILKDSRRRDSG